VRWIGRQRGCELVASYVKSTNATPHACTGFSHDGIAAAGAVSASLIPCTHIMARIVLLLAVAAKAAALSQQNWLKLPDVNPGTFTRRDAASAAAVSTIATPVAATAASSKTASRRAAEVQQWPRIPVWPSWAGGRVIPMGAFPGPRLPSARWHSGGQDTHASTSAQACPTRTRSCWWRIICTGSIPGIRCEGRSEPSARSRACRAPQRPYTLTSTALRLESYRLDLELTG